MSCPRRARTLTYDTRARPETADEGTRALRVVAAMPLTTVRPSTSMSKRTGASPSYRHAIQTPSNGGSKHAVTAGATTRAAVKDADVPVGLDHAAHAGSCRRRRHDGGHHHGENAAPAPG